MKHKLLNAEPERSFAVVLDVGDEAISCLTRLARDEHLDAARLTAIGAFSDVVVGFFDMARKDYERIVLTEQVEVISLVGDIALGPDGTPGLHVHVVLGKRDGTAWGGHLIEAHVQPTLEVMLVESPSHLRRRIDPSTGLALIDLQVGDAGAKT